MQLCLSIWRPACRLILAPGFKLKTSGLASAPSAGVTLSREFGLGVVPVGFLG